jgi:hypothetical protein
MSRIQNAFTETKEITVSFPINASTARTTAITKVICFGLESFMFFLLNYSKNLKMIIAPEKIFSGFLCQQENAIVVSGR